MTQERNVRFYCFAFIILCGSFTTIPAHAVTAGQFAEDCARDNPSCYAFIYGFTTGTSLLLLEQAERNAFKDRKNRRAIQKKFSYHCAPDLKPTEFAKHMIQYVKDVPASVDLSLGYVFSAMLRRDFPC